MPDFKCVACRIRTRRAGDTPSHGDTPLGAGDPCPGCGSSLEPIGEPTEVVGFRSVTTANRIVDSDAPVGDLIARRNAIYVQEVHDAIEAARWVDDGGFAAVAVALPTADRLLPHAGAPGENGTT
jgi:hypothetical protein